MDIDIMICRNCSSQKFYLDVSGLIVCCGCGAEMNMFWIAHEGREQKSEEVKNYAN